VKENIITELNISNPDSFYEKLINLHEGLSDKESALLNSKIILIMANQIGDEAILSDLLLMAKE
jgi:hypothetical protein